MPITCRQQQGGPARPEHRKNIALFFSFDIETSRAIMSSSSRYTFHVHYFPKIIRLETVFVEHKMFIYFFPKMS